MLWFKSGEDSIYYVLPESSIIINSDSLFVDVESGSTIDWWVYAISNRDTVECLSLYNFIIHSNNVDESRGLLNYEFSIFSTYPNPFNPETTITYSIPHPGNLRINLFDLQGRNISQEILSISQAGRFSKVFDLSDYPTGVYFVEMGFESVVQRQKLVLVR